MWTQKGEFPLYIKGKIGILKYGHKKGNPLYILLQTSINRRYRASVYDFLNMCDIILVGDNIVILLSCYIN